MLFIFYWLTSPFLAVGRWQKNKDLTWYAKSGAGEMSVEEARKEEIRKIKEAEQDALSEALGFKTVKRHMDPVDQDEVKRAIGEPGDDNEEGKGVGFGKRAGKSILDGASGGRDAGYTVKGEFRPAERERWRERGDRRERSRSEGRGDRDRHRHRDRDRGGVRERRQRSRTRSRDRHRYRRDNEDRDRRRRRRSRSRTPRRDDDRGHSRR